MSAERLNFTGRTNQKCYEHSDFNNLLAGKTVKIPLNDQTLRTLIWTPDASRAMALIGNTPDAYNQTWHLPTA
ncbi:hypothetical protein AAULR_26116, partial [Lacticaseibacillus rhamnosus MTCC 5462]